MSERPGSPEDERAHPHTQAEREAGPVPDSRGRGLELGPGHGSGGSPPPGPNHDPGHGPRGGGREDGHGGGLRLGTAPGYPPGRPDFEPPPAWAHPNPSAPNGAPPTGPLTTPLQPAPTPSSGRPERRRIGPLVALIAVVALLASVGGVTAGVYATMRWWDSARLEDVQPITDSTGGKGRTEAFPKPQNVTTVANALLPGVVQIKVAAGGGKATGSGFVIRQDGHILTNNHVIAMAADDQGSIKVTFEDGREVNASIVGRSPSYDLAVIKVSGEERLKPVPLGDSDEVTVGEPVIAVGSPLGLAGTVTSGIISAKNRAVTAGGSGETSFISGLQTDAAINPGNSGGPLANLRAEVIGVNSAIATVGDEDFFGEERQQGNIGLGFAIPINQARRTANQLIETGHAVYPVVGARVDRSYTGPGARIVDVVPGGGAERAGLQGGDLVTVINGHKVTGADDLIVQIRRYLPGDVIRLTYVRTGEPQDVLVTLGEEVD